MGTEDQLDIFKRGVQWGDTFEGERDGPRSSALLSKVRECLRNGRWWTLQELMDSTGGREGSVARRVRDLRDKKFGGHDIQTRHVGGGVWQYRIRGLTSGE